MSINDPQWGNSHRPEQKEPEQAPENAGAAPVQPEPATPDPAPLSHTDIPKETKAVSSGGQRSPNGQPPEGPPDLEELWQQLVYRVRCRLAVILRRPPPPVPQPLARPASMSGGGASPSDTPAFNWQALSWQSWLIGVALIFGAWLVSGFYLVDANQRGVVSRFGIVSGTTDPGWQWRWPYPFESVRLVNVTGDRTLEVGSASAGRQAQGLMLTADQNLVSVSYAVVYQVSDPVAYVSQLEAPAELLGVLSETALRETVAGQSLAVLQQAVTKHVEPDAKAADRPIDPAVNHSLVGGARQQIQAVLDQIQAGMVVKNIIIRDLRLPGPVLQAAKQAEQDTQVSIRAFRDAQTAATDGLIKAYKLANQLQGTSLAYGEAMDNAIARLNAGAPADMSAAQGDVSRLNQSLRQQMPLLFESNSDILARITTANGVKADVKRSTPGSTSSLPAATGEWRDRELMRNRDRVDRPGSGS